MGDELLAALTERGAGDRAATSARPGGPRAASTVNRWRGARLAAGPGPARGRAAVASARLHQRGPAAPRCALRCRGWSLLGVLAAGRRGRAGSSTARRCSGSARSGDRRRRWSARSRSRAAAGGRRRHAAGPGRHRRGRAPGCARCRRWLGRRVAAAGRTRWSSRWSSGPRWRWCRRADGFALIDDDGCGVPDRSPSRPAGVPLCGWPRPARTTRRPRPRCGCWPR